MQGQIMRAQDGVIRRLLEDRRFAERMARHPIHARLGEWISLGRGTRVLELGCGPGRYVAMLSTLGFDVIGVDLHPFPSGYIVSGRSRARLLDRIDAADLPFSGESFDHVVCSGALLYFERPEAAVREMHRVLRPGGRLALRTVNAANPYTRRTGRKLDPASRNLYTMGEIMDLVQRHGFVVGPRFAYGFWPPIAPGVWWYLSSVWTPLWLHDMLSSALPEETRVNNVVFAHRA
jgi:SAM-dependent methyltransferase